MTQQQDIEIALAPVVAEAAGLAADRRRTVAVNDPQRSTRTTEVLARLQAARPDAVQRILIATGTHSYDDAARAAFAEWLAAAAPSAEIAWHDCLADDLVEVDGDAPWRCHRWLLDESTGLLAIGSCEPHYFAGVTGAHKTITIGCASRADIEANHVFALSADARPGRLAGNPVHEGVAAMVRSLQARREALAINLLQSGETILAAAAGGPLEALESLAGRVRSTYFRTIPRPAEALILRAEGVLAESFYQADKAIKNSEWAVRDGGVLVLVADCAAGIGQDHFMALLAECADHSSALALIGERGYRLGDHKAVKLRHLTDIRDVHVFVVSDGLSDLEVKLLGFTRADSPAAALAAAGIDGSRPDVHEVTDACNMCMAVEA